MREFIYNAYASGESLSATLNPDTSYSIGAFKICDIRLHAQSYVKSGEFVAQIDNNEGFRYDQVIARQALDNIRDFQQIYDPPITCRKGDLLVCTTNNAETTNNLGLTVVIVEI